jgi:hypothetical protein
LPCCKGLEKYFLEGVWESQHYTVTATYHTYRRVAGLRTRTCKTLLWTDEPHANIGYMFTVIYNFTTGHWEDAWPRNATADIPKRQLYPEIACIIYLLFPELYTWHEKHKCRLTLQITLQMYRVKLSELKNMSKHIFPHSITMSFDKYMFTSVFCTIWTFLNLSIQYTWQAPNWHVVREDVAPALLWYQDLTRGIRQYSILLWRHLYIYTLVFHFFRLDYLYMYVWTHQWNRLNKTTLFIIHVFRM